MYGRISHEHSPVITGSRVLQFLRINLHVLFALLLIVGAVNACVDEGQSPGRRALALLLTALLGGLYMAGTVYENRRAKTWAVRSVKLRWLTALWLVLITSLWVSLMTLSSGFTWTVFPLLFLYLYLLPLLGGLIAVVLLTVFALIYPVFSGEAELTPGGIIGPVLGALIAVIIFLAYKGLYDDAVRHAHIAQQLRATRSELAQTQHEAGRLEERERLAREIHDTLAQGLSSIVLMSRAAPSTLESADTQTTAEALKVIETSVQSNLDEARRFIKDLSSPALDMSLTDSLQRLVIGLNQQAEAQQSGLVVEFSSDVQDGERLVSEATAQELLRIAQGALSNVVTHAHASRAVLTFNIWDQLLTLDVFDNGIGFDPTQVTPQEGKGYGLVSLRSRAENLGGQLSLEQAEPSGTILTVQVPLNSSRKF